MFRTGSKHFGELREYLDRVPVIDTHEHNTGVTKPAGDVFAFLLGEYFVSDLESAAFGMEEELKSLREQGANAPAFARKLEIFGRLYGKAGNTAYARGMETGLRECWGIEKIANESAIRELERKLAGREPSYYGDTMEKLGIKAQIADVFDLKPNTGGEIPNCSKGCRLAFPLPQFHAVRRKDDITSMEGYLGRAVTSLDEYVEGFRVFFKKCADYGVVCVKDQSAYWRTLGYGNPCKAEAESVFNDIASNPRDTVGDDRARALDDWLFHQFLRIAAEYDLPVQLHTGHMAGIRNDVRKANAALLAPVLELHKNVRFDLFHGNWPYMDDYLFLGKNYPNVRLNLCWVQCIDPVYCVELMKRAVMTVPQSKVFAFGGDTREIEWVAGYLSMARDNVACALSELVDSGWLDLDGARQIGADWFFNNPNEFYRLGFQPFGK